MSSSSVHLQPFVDLQKVPFDSQLVKKMDISRKICNAILSLRKTSNIKVKIPLSKAIIYSEQDLSLDKSYIDLIIDEVNIKSVQFSNDFKGFAKEDAVLNLKVCGKKLGKNLGKVMSMVNKGQWSKKEEKLLVGEFTLDPEDFTIQMNIIGNNENVFTIAEDKNNIFVRLNTELTEELLDEGVARGFVRIIQQLRKDIGCSISDKIIIKVNSSDKTMVRILSNQVHLDYILSQVLSSNKLFHFNVSESDNSFAVKNIDEVEFSINVKKA